MEVVSTGREVITLRDSPLVNNLCETQEDSLKAARYPLRIIEEDNLLMRLDTEISSEEMFGEYLYRSSINKPYIDHCRRMWKFAEGFNPTRIADIGGNDGALLNAFKEEANIELDLTNIDASSSFKRDNETRGITYVNEYWGDTVFSPKFDLITSTNVFQHTPDYHKFLYGIQCNLDGVWILEFPYFLETVRTNQFDQIYHEHVLYWLLTPLYHLFKEYDLKIIDISMEESHGGSMRVTSSNRPEHSENLEKIDYYLDLEANFNFHNWSEVFEKKLKEDRRFIANLRGSVAAFGAAAKGCIYLNCINQNKIQYIIDDTPQKQHKFMPGLGLEILNRDVLRTDPPLNIIILPHNFKRHISRSLREGGYKGRIFTMLPEIQEIK